MKFHILTLFPEMVPAGLGASVIGRAIERKLIEVNAVNIRDYTSDRHGSVDDYTYGGGAGMLLQAQPVFDAHRAVAGGKTLRTIYVTPQGKPFNQRLAQELARERELIFLCGHYEGIDERVLEEVVTDYVSVGDYVLTGGELPAMVMVDAIARLLPGVLGNQTSAHRESFHNDLLEYPQYTRPEEWRGRRVPPVLLSGNRKRIEEWRLNQARERTERIRPDLYQRYLQKEEAIRRLARKKRNNIHLMETLARGDGEILYERGDSLLVCNPGCDFCLIEAGEREDAQAMLSLIPQSCELVLTGQRFVAEMLCAHLGFFVFHECHQLCFTRREALPVRYGDIRELGEADIAYVQERYRLLQPRYAKERIRAGAMYGAFAEGRQVGFAGIHEDGSMGMLYVDEEFRGRGIGAALEAYVINRELEAGHIPYAHVAVGNEDSLRLQEKLGLYRADRTVWWLGRDPESCGK